MTDFLVQHNFRLLTTDKEGFFVVISSNAFGPKALAAVTKNFRESTAKLAQRKREAVVLLQELNLEKTAQAVKEV